MLNQQGQLSFKLFQFYLIVSIIVTSLTFLFLTYRFFWDPDLTYLYLTTSIYAVITVMALINILTSVGLFFKKKWAWISNLLLTLITIGGVIYVSVSDDRFQWPSLVGPVVLIIFLLIHRRRFFTKDQSNL